MRMITRRHALAAAGTGLALIATVAISPAADAANGHVVVVKGLNNPRQLAWNENNGALIVAEAGRGGTTCGDSGCLGPTGSVSEIKHPATRVNGKPSRILKGLPSGAAPDGSFATGADGADVKGDSLYTIITGGSADLPPFPGSDQAGWLLKSRYGSTGKMADITAYETKYNPDRKQVDSNPYAVLALNHTRRILVADAAGNSVIAVDPRTAARKLFAVFPTAAGQPEFVPTSIAEDSKGYIYIGGLGGEKPGAAKVVKFAPDGRRVKTFTGFTTITGVAVDKKGFLYVSELFGGNGFPGQIVKVGGTKRWTKAVPLPAGIAVDGTQNVFVSAWSVADSDGAPGSQEFPPLEPGQVWKVRF
jgi:hypothetical protein